MHQFAPLKLDKTNDDDKIYLPLPECDDDHPCQGLSEHAHFQNFGMGFLTLFRVATGDNWNGIMKVNKNGLAINDEKSAPLLSGQPLIKAFK